MKRKVTPRSIVPLCRCPSFGDCENIKERRRDRVEERVRWASRTEVRYVRTYNNTTSTYDHDDERFYIPAVCAHSPRTAGRIGLHLDEGFAFE